MLDCLQQFKNPELNILVYENIFFITSLVSSHGVFVLCEKEIQLNLRLCTPQYALATAPPPRQNLVWYLQFIDLSFHCFSLRIHDLSSSTKYCFTLTTKQLATDKSTMTHLSTDTAIKLYTDAATDTPCTQGTVLHIHQPSTHAGTDSTP